MLDQFPVTTSNSSCLLDRPKTLTLKEFESLPVPEEERERRELIYKLEESMYRLPHATAGDNIPFQPVHRFSKGVYHRELLIPAGFCVVGKRHALEHIVMLVKGHCLCVTERGKEELEGPLTFISPAGEKRVVYSITDTLWVTIHPTDKTDLKEIEDEVIIAEPSRQLRYDKIMEDTQKLLKAEDK